MSTIITHRRSPTTKSTRWNWPAVPLSLEVGKLAELANAAVMVGYGDTRVLVAPPPPPSPDGIDFFPLSVDFEERMYAVARIPGSFMQPPRGPPSCPPSWPSRVIDRPIRPLFPMTSAMTCPPAPSWPGSRLLPRDRRSDRHLRHALAISDIPWNGPIGAVKWACGRRLVINPTSEQRAKSWTSPWSPPARRWS